MSKFIFRCTLSLFKLSMNENMFKYGSYNIDKDLLLQNIQSNIDKYIEHQQLDSNKANLFKNAVKLIINGINNNTVSGDGFGNFLDSSYTIQQNNDIIDASEYIHSIANALGAALINHEKATNKKENISKKFDLSKHGFENSFLKSLSPLDKSQQAITASIQGYIDSFDGDKTKALQNLAERISSYQNEYKNFADLDFSEHGITAEEYNSDLNSFKELLSQGILNNQLAIRLGFKNIIDNVYNKISSKLQNNKITLQDREKIKVNAIRDYNAKRAKSIESTTSTKTAPWGDVFSYYDWEKDQEFNKSPRNRYLESKATKKAKLEQFKNSFKHKTSPSTLLPIAFEQGGILKAAQGIQFPKEVNLLNDDRYVGWDNYFTVDNSGNYTLKPNVNNEEFNNWLQLVGLSYNAPVDNYGTNYQRNASINYNYLYLPNATSKQWANQDASSREGTELKTTVNDNTNELDLNTHWQNNRMYLQENGEDLRKADFVNFVKQAYKNNQFTNVNELLTLYNTGVDEDYAYKQSKAGTTYETNDETKKFNDRNFARYNSQNTDLLHGFDNNLSSTNGRTTMARSVDITEDEKVIDLSDVIWEDNNLAEIMKELLSVNKSKTGHYYVKGTPKLQVVNNKLSQNSGLGSLFGGTNNDPNKETESTEIPERKEELNLDVPLATFKYLNSRYLNKNLLDLNNDLQPLYYDSKEDHRITYGNLRALVQGKRNLAELQRLASKPITSDGSLQMARMLDATNLGLQEVTKGEMLDDQTLGENLEKSYQQALQNHEDRHNKAMKNRENAKAVQDLKLLAKMNYLRSNYESTVNYVNELLGIKKSNENLKKTYRDYFYNQALLSNIENNPNSHLIKLGLPTLDGNELTIWRKGLSNPSALSNEEYATYQRIRSRISDIHTHYLAKEYGVDMPLFTPEKITTPWTPSLSFDKVRETVNHKKGGKVTSNMTKTIIAYLKESNKNYNKAIDRSIRGLYNHIKLLRK